MPNVYPEGWHTYENGMLVVRLPSGQVKRVPIKRVGSNYLPRQIRRARGALTRAKREEKIDLIRCGKWPTRSAFAASSLEYARAVCHALQYLLAP